MRGPLFLSFLLFLSIYILCGALYFFHFFHFFQIILDAGTPISFISFISFNLYWVRGPLFLSFLSFLSNYIGCGDPYFFHFFHFFQIIIYDAGHFFHIIYDARPHMSFNFFISFNSYTVQGLLLFVYFIRIIHIINNAGPPIFSINFLLCFYITKENKLYLFI